VVFLINYIFYTTFIFIILLYNIFYKLNIKFNLYFLLIIKREREREIIIMSNISDEKVLELFRKYEKEVLEGFLKYVNSERYSRNGEVLNEEGIWDELFNGMSDRYFMREVLEKIEGSVGLEIYGFDYEEEF